MYLTTAYIPKNVFQAQYRLYICVSVFVHTHALSLPECNYVFLHMFASLIIVALTYIATYMCTYVDKYMDLLDVEWGYLMYCN